ncbi:hypothetical protein SCP_1301200 [Sparassis crispa]|uniref:Uncharacterized protein n=1 Tax=Sparassis crispa TaxID=139825 RepID=A0A401H1J6_9APHY|nr:hypothetical protein SCP_1301200 [Sparassis crispa]GBE88305.1 hypothetical protein SCP_1301200 [Sparassis crispa]
MRPPYAYAPSLPSSTSIIGLTSSTLEDGTTSTTHDSLLCLVDADIRQDRERGIEEYRGVALDYFMLQCDNYRRSPD